MSKEADAAIGAGPDLDDRIAMLEEELAVPSERETKAQQLADLKRRKADRDAVALQKEAKDRVHGITRALGSLADQSKQDNTRLLDAARKFAEQIVGLNERYERCLALRHEAAALAEAFGLPMPALPTVIVPALRPEVQQAFEITSSVGVRDNGYFPPALDAGGGRTYAELRDLPGVGLLRRKTGQRS